MNETLLLEWRLNRLLLLRSERLHHVYVFHGGESENPDERLVEFAPKAAEAFSQLLTFANIANVGVGWGTTVNDVIDALKETPPDSPRDPPISFIPTCGESVVEGRYHLSSSWLAQKINRCVNGTAKDGSGGKLRSLRGIIDIVPVDATKDFVDEYRKRILERSPQWKEIFYENGTEPPLIKKLDAMLTSLASPKQPGKRTSSEEETTAAGINRDELFKLVMYDIGGAYIPNEEGNQTVEHWNECWTGITIEHYQHCAESAAKDNADYKNHKPGVIVVAIGGEKVQYFLNNPAGNKSAIILNAVDRGLVNTLMIDDDLASALVDLLDAQTKSS